jgi:hypothetical protein
LVDARHSSASRAPLSAQKQFVAAEDGTRGVHAICVIELGVMNQSVTGPVCLKNLPALAAINPDGHTIVIGDGGRQRRARRKAAPTRGNMIRGVAAADN